MKSEISKAVTASGKTKVRIAGETAYYDAVFQVLILAQSQEWQPVRHSINKKKWHLIIR